MCVVMEAGREQQLHGGRTTGAVRLGETVRRPSRPWSPAVQWLLQQLNDRGVPGVPRPLGTDQQGRQVQSYLPGDTVGTAVPWPAWVWSDTTLVQVGRWLRAVHDATDGVEPPADARWFAGQWHPGLVLGHQDAAPYNAVWSDGRLVGFVDWDTAGPSSREFDLALCALLWVPLHARAVVEPLGFAHFDDRRRRMHLLLDAYGLTTSREAFGNTVIRRARVNADTIRRLAADGSPIYRALLPQAQELDEAVRELDALPASFWVRAADGPSPGG